MEPFFPVVTSFSLPDPPSVIVEFKVKVPRLHSGLAQAKWVILVNH